MITTRTLASLAVSSSAAWTWSSSSPDSALNCSGRFSVSVAIPSCTSRKRIDAWGCGTALMDFSSRVDRGGRLRLLAQEEFLDLADRSLRQLAEHDRAWRLELRHARPAMLDDLGFGCVRPRFQLDERARRLAPFRIGH